MREFNLLTQLGMGGFIFLQVTMTICFFIVILFRNEQIRFPRLFRVACFCLILSVVVPPITMPLLAPLVGTVRPGFQDGGWLFWIGLSSAPLLIGLSMILAFTSLAIGPEPKKKPRSPAAVKKHALDD